MGTSIHGGSRAVILTFHCFTDVCWTLLAASGWGNALERGARQPWLPLAGGWWFEAQGRDFHISLYVFLFHFILFKTMATDFDATGEGEKYFPH